ncbi:MAG: glucose-1-phosphate adenylyltransferase subunit GlgD [Eubacteriales bacterium]|nr:glucose-1-phosphate adenylyltransferase subunit GlgD [Eubacteriales bacterium]
MDAVGIIFADAYDVNLDQLTGPRTLAALPFGGRYRVIDFNLSNMVNSGIRNVGIVTTQHYQSLMGHVRAGSEWDLDRKSSHLTFLPPYSLDGETTMYENRLEALQANLHYLTNVKEKYIIMTSCNFIANIDFEKMLDYHIKSGANVTGLYVKNVLNPKDDVVSTVYSVENGKITDIKSGTTRHDGMFYATNTYVIGREYLIDIIKELAGRRGNSFRTHVVMPEVKAGKAAAYCGGETVLFLDNLQGYLQASLSLLDKDIRNEIFYNPDRRIITEVKDSAPTKYGDTAEISNSLIADGALIEGKVVNSIIFRGCHIKKGAVVENSVVMQDSTIGENVRLGYAVLDKQAIINDNRMLCGYITHPFFVEKKTVI